MSELTAERLEQLRRELEEADALEVSPSRTDRSKARWKRETWARRHGKALLAEIEQLWAENHRLISDIRLITAPIEVGGGADAYLRAEVERLRREREALVAALLHPEIIDLIEEGMVGDYKIRRKAREALALLESKKDGG